MATPAPVPKREPKPPAKTFVGPTTAQLLAARLSRGKPTAANQATGLQSAAAAQPAIDVTVTSDGLGSALAHGGAAGASATAARGGSLAADRGVHPEAAAAAAAAAYSQPARWGSSRRAVARYQIFCPSGSHITAPAPAGPGFPLEEPANILASVIHEKLECRRKTQDEFAQRVTSMSQHRAAKQGFGCSGWEHEAARQINSRNSSGF